MYENVRLKANPFLMFNIKVDFFISENELLNNYYKIMQKAHPDQYKTKPEKEFAIIQVIKINAAFEALKNPVTRAEVMLEMTDINIMDVNTDRDLLESLVVLQEIDDYEKITETLKKAQLEFNTAFHSRNKDMLKKNFLIMKYLGRISEKHSSATSPIYG